MFDFVVFILIAKNFLFYVLHFIDIYLEFHHLKNRKLYL